MVTDHTDLKVQRPLAVEIPAIQTVDLCRLCAAPTSTNPAWDVE